MKWLHNWLHGACQAREAAMFREADSAQTEVGRLQRSLADLQRAHDSLLLAMQSKTHMEGFDRMLSEMFTEVEMTDERHTWLTPTFADREEAVS